MLVHGHERRMLARMQALIELNTGSDLHRRAALSEGVARAALRPWVLPAIPGWLGADAHDGVLVIPVRAAQAY